MTINRKILQTVIHLAVWTGFLLLPFISFSGGRDQPFTPDRRFQVLFFIINLCFIGFYYLHSLVLIPKLLAARKTTWYVVIILLLLAFFLAIPYIYFQFVEFPTPRFIQNLQRLPADRHKQPRRFWLFPFTGTIMLFLLIMIISGGIKVINQWFKTERRNEEIVREKVTTELALLKSQINPHFFFNTLNNIYSLAVTSSPDTATAVLKLSSIMRYVLDDARSNYVPLNKEIQFIENYIALQSVRLTDKVTVRFIKEGDAEEKQIAPLLLIAFVENAFKYGISTHLPSVIDIALKVTNKHLNFVVTNQKLHNNNTDITQTGTGLINTKRRLELLYPDKYSLQIEDKDNLFHVHLILDLI